MRDSRSWRAKSVGMHLALWIALALWSYHSAGPFKFASCWPIAMMYLPFALLWAAIAVTSLGTVIVSIARPQTKASIWFFAACHGLLLVGGMLAALLAGHAATGQVSCL